MLNVLITGGAKRIGKGLSLKFAELGWNIILTYNKSESEATHTLAELEKYGIIVNKYQCDLTNKDELERTFKFIYNENKFIDVLINNVGTFPEKSSFSELDFNQWQNTFDINLNISFNTIKEYSKYQKTGRIINIASVGGLAIWDRRIDYNVSKSALIQFTKTIAKDLAPNFTCNIINPGLISFNDIGYKDSTYLNKNKIPMGRYGNIDDVFDAVYYFSTSSKYITGQMLNIDGGLHL